MKHLPKPEPYRPYKPMFIDYIKPLSASITTDKVFIQYIETLKRIAKEEINNGKV